MLTKVLIANRGDQPLSSGEAAQPNCLSVEDQAGDFTAGVSYVY